MAAAEAIALKDEGNKFYKEQNYLKAAGLYTKAVRKDKTNPVLHNNLCAALLGLSKFEKALTSVDTCLELGYVKDEKAQFRRGLALNGLERHEEACHCFAAALEINPKNRDAHRLEDKAALECRRACKAAGEEVPAIAVRPKNGVAKPDFVKKEQKAPDGSAFAFAEGEGLGFLSVKSTPSGGIAEGMVAAAAAAEATSNVELSTDAELDQQKARLTKGAAIPYSAARVEAFTTAELACLCDKKNASQYVQPLAIFLPGRIVEEWQVEGGEDNVEGSGLAIRSAFETPETQKETLELLRNNLENGAHVGSHAVLILSTKQQIAFPQVWKDKENAWPFGSGSGWLVQRECQQSEHNKAWYVDAASLKAVEMDYAKFKIMDKLFK